MTVTANLAERLVMAALYVIGYVGGWLGCMIWNGLF